MRTIPFLIAALLCSCVAEPREIATSQALCTVDDQQAGLCDGPLGGWDPASRYPTTATEAGQTVDRVSCGGVSTTVGDHWTVCNVSVGNTVLLSCTFYYNVPIAGDCCNTLTSYSCG